MELTRFKRFLRLQEDYYPSFRDMLEVLYIVEMIVEECEPFEDSLKADGALYDEQIADLIDVVCDKVVHVLGETVGSMAITERLMRDFGDSDVELALERYRDAQKAIASDTSGLGDLDEHPVRLESLNEHPF